MCLQLDPPYSRKVIRLPNLEGELPLFQDHTGEFTTVPRIKRVQEHLNYLILTFFKEPSYLTLRMGGIEQKVFFPKLGAHIEPLKLVRSPRPILPVLFPRTYIQLVTDRGFILHAVELLHPETLRKHIPDYQEAFPQYDSMFSLFRRVAGWN